jgi:hypothetical protein
MQPSLLMFKHQAKPDKSAERLFLSELKQVTHPLAQ